jgi:hypothetical protein
MADTVTEVLQALVYCDNCRKSENCNNLTSTVIGSACNKCIREGKPCKSLGNDLYIQVRDELWKTLIPTDAADLWTQVFNKHMVEHPALVQAAIVFASTLKHPGRPPNQRPRHKGDYLTVSGLLKIGRSVQGWEITADNCAAFYIFYLLFSAALLQNALLHEPHISLVSSVTSAMRTLQHIWSKVDPFVVQLYEDPRMAPLKDNITKVHLSTLEKIPQYGELIAFINHLPHDEWGVNTRRVKACCIEWVQHLYTAYYSMLECSEAANHKDRLLLLWPATKVYDEEVWNALTKPGHNEDEHLLWKLILVHWAAMCHDIHSLRSTWWLADIGPKVIGDFSEYYAEQRLREEGIVTCNAATYPLGVLGAAGIASRAVITQRIAHNEADDEALVAGAGSGAGTTQ